MKVNFNFDTGARRIRLRSEDPLEQAVLAEMAFLCEKGINMKIRSIQLSPGTAVRVDVANTELFGEFEIEMKINGFDKEKKSE